MIPGLEDLLKSYLSLMNEFDNEEIVDAFENIMIIFADHIKPYALDICKHLKEQYIRCMNQDQGNSDEYDASIMTAIASLTSMRRILDVVQKDHNLIH